MDGNSGNYRPPLAKEARELLQSAYSGIGHWLFSKEKFNIQRRKSSMLLCSVSTKHVACDYSVQFLIRVVHLPQC